MWIVKLLKKKGGGLKNKFNTFLIDEKLKYWSKLLIPLISVQVYVSIRQLSLSIISLQPHQLSHHLNNLRHKVGHV